MNPLLLWLCVTAFAEVTQERSRSLSTDSTTTDGTLTGSTSSEGSIKSNSSSSSTASKWSKWGLARINPFSFRFKVPPVLLTVVPITEPSKCPQTSQQLLDAIFSNDKSKESALYCKNSLDLIAKLNPTQVQVYANSLRYTSQVAITNGLLALMQRYAKLSDLYLTTGMNQTFNECMDEFASIVKTNYNFDPKQVPSPIVNFADPKASPQNALYYLFINSKTNLIDANVAPSCAKLPTFSKQLKNLVYYHFPSTEVNEKVAAMALSSKTLFSGTWGSSKELAASKNLKTILSFLEQMPDYKKMVATFKLEDKENLIKPDWNEINKIDLHN